MRFDPINCSGITLGPPQGSLWFITSPLLCGSSFRFWDKLKRFWVQKMFCLMQKKCFSLWDSQNSWIQRPPNPSKIRVSKDIQSINYKYNNYEDNVWWRSSSVGSKTFQGSLTYRYPWTWNTVLNGLSTLVWSKSTEQQLVPVSMTSPGLLWRSAAGPVLYSQ